jgi:hypothetical protein
MPSVKKATSTMILKLARNTPRLRGWVYRKELILNIRELANMRTRERATYSERIEYPEFVKTHTHNCLIVGNTAEYDFS